MDAFTHVTGLLGLVFVIALALLLERASELVLARAQVRFSPLAALTAVNAVLLVYASWLALWEVRRLTHWTLGSVTPLFLYALSISFVCALALPRLGQENCYDMEAHYWRERRTFYSAWFANCMVAIACNLSLSAGLGHANLINENLYNIFSAAVAVFAVAVPARWAQWTAGLALMALIVGYLLVFNSRLT